VTIRTVSFTRGLGASYFATGINIAYTAVSVPLALHYLGKEQFGLWALAQQITGYLILLDFGVSSAVSRFIANHKDDVNGGDYGRLLLAGGIVFAVQGSLIAVVGLVFSIFAPLLFAIPTPLAADFTNVLMIITSLAGFSIFSRSLGVPLWSFHRMDFSYLLGSITLISGFVMLWIGFHFGLGIYSLAASGLPAALLCPLITFYFCKKHRFYPSAKSGWQIPTFADIRRVFSFGKDAALMSLGSQMVNASQIMIISRFVGLDAAAIFSVGTKLYSLGQQLVARIIGAAAPALTELFVRGEISRFSARFFDVLSISAFIATLIGSFLICGNSGGVSFWTSGVIAWSPWADGVLGALLVATSFTRCLTELFVFRGNLKSVRYIFLMEGLFSVALAIPAVINFGLPGLLFTCLFVHLAVVLGFSLKAANKVLTQPTPIIQQILKSFLILFFIFVITAIWGPHHFKSIQAVFVVISLTVIAGVFGWVFMLQHSLRSEICNKFIFFYK
jgi:O-antigen/teichoic acid export membrane protein